nr:PREDICTED: uncharacterized protein LOC109037573 [Bemisia tabaci]XP_018907856.1 PREDICTED: uncharacterized protein LOC109037573 [Bemisia tabaci]
MDASVRSLIVALIVVGICGERTPSSGDAPTPSSICFAAGHGRFCAHLRAAGNLSAAPSIDFVPNLVLPVPFASALNLSHNAIANLRFRTSTIQLIVDYARNLTFDDPAQFKTATSLSGLQSLILSHNRLRNIRGIFTPLENLRHLDLSYNLIVDIDEAFAESSRLLTLALNNNQIESLRRETFDHLRNLQTLDLSGNRFTRLNLDIFEYLSDLLVLRLNDNFRSSEENFILSAGQRFERLEMAATMLTRIPIALTRSIRELDLSDNELVSLQCGEMDSYPLLRNLTLKGNKLTTVEEDSLGRLEYLLELNLHGNHLRQIPLSLPPGLRYLDLGANRIDSVNSTDLQGLANLRVLILNRNKIEYIEETAFNAISSLDHLDLSNNPIVVLTNRHFVGLRVVNLQLSGLDRLSCAGIVSCDKTFPFTELDHVEKIDLESSPVLAHQLALDQSAQQALSRLRYLSLANANLTTLNHILAKNLRRLDTLDLSQNPLNCSGLSWLKEWLLSLKPNFTDESSGEANRRDESVTISIQLTQENVPDRQKNESVEVQIPVCFSPEQERGKYLTDLKFETTSGKKADRADVPKLEGTKIKERYEEKSTEQIHPPTKTNKLPEDTKTSRKSKNLTSMKERTEAKKSTVQEIQTSAPEQLVLLKTEGLNHEGSDIGDVVSNSVSTVEKSDEVYYQSDEPDVNTTQSKSPAVLKSFGVLHSKDVEYATTEPIQADGPFASSLTSSELDEAKASKLEVKTINKTHIQLSRSGSRRNQNVSRPESRFNETGNPTTTPAHDNHTSVKVPESTTAKKTKNSQIGSHDLAPAGNSSITKQEPSDYSVMTHTSEGSPKYNSSAKVTADSKSSVKGKYGKSDNRRIVSTTTIDPTMSETSEKVNEQTTTTQKPRKSKTHDERFGSRPARKKLSKKIKNETTSQAITPPTLQETTVSSEKQEEETRSRKDQTKREKIEETRITGTKNSNGKFTERGRALMTHSEIIPDTVNDKIPHKQEERTAERLGTDLKSNTPKHVPEVNDRSSPSDEAYDNSRMNDTPGHVSENKNVTDNSERNVGKPVKTRMDGKSQKNNESSKSTSTPTLNESKTNQGENTGIEKNKVMNLAEMMGLPVDETPSNQNKNDKHRKSSIIATPDEKIGVARDIRNGGSSDGAVNPSQQGLSREQLKGDSDKTSSDLGSEQLADKKMGKEELDKGGSHPGMLVFLLIVSVLLFTLSLMLISHWTWCRRLNMYELGDQQILEESDYEINSLTNFKEPQRW